MAPTRLACQAPAGRTPVIAHRARHRLKVSAAAALCYSPRAGHARLHFETFPDAFVDNYLYAQFLRGLLARVRGPVVLIPDNAPAHRGEWTDDLYDDVPWLADLAAPLPPYAPDLNAADHMWAYAKGHRGLGNFAPEDVPELDDALCGVLGRVADDQRLLRGFLGATGLGW